MAQGGVTRRRIVVFEWLDAVSSHGWEPAKGDQPHRCVAAGILIAETNEAVTVAVTVSKAVTTDDGREDQMNAVMVIPRGWISGPIVTVGWAENNAFRPVGKRRGKTE